MLREIDRLCRDGITQAELAKVQSQLRARLVYDAASVTDIAHQLGFFETIGSWRDYHDVLPRMASVTLDSVQDVARRYLTASNRTIGWFEPQDSTDHRSQTAEVAGV
jgi:zinc protease